MHVVSDNPTPKKSPAPTIDYRTLVITTAVGAAVAILATMGVQWAIARARRTVVGKDEDHQQHALAQNPFAQALPQIPPGGVFWIPPQAQGAMPMMPPQSAFPQALQYAPQAQAAAPMRGAANESMPGWFATFAKQQDKRFKQLESQLAGDDLEDVG